MVNHVAILQILLLASDSLLVEGLRDQNTVQSVSVKTTATSPQRTIIHLKDWHFVSEEDYNRDKDANGAEGLPATYEKFIESVRKVQTEQEAVLRMLIKKHGIKTVYKEGLVVGEEFYPDDSKVVSAMANVLWSPTGRNKADLETQRLGIGPAGKLLAEKKLAIKSCEDFTLFSDCNPFDEDGKPREVSEKTLEARESFIVKHILTSKDKVSVVILGGAHDLSDNVPKGVRLIEVTVKEYAKVAGTDE